MSKFASGIAIAICAAAGIGALVGIVYLITTVAKWAWGT
jgi:hypothetical protein